MKLYNVCVYNYVEAFNDVYMVWAMTMWTLVTWRFSG